RFLADIPADLIIPHQMGGSSVVGPQRGSKSGGLPNTISDTEQDHTNKSRNQEAHLGKQAPCLTVSSYERNDLPDHSWQAVAWPLAPQVSSLAPSSAHKQLLKAGIKIRHARFGEGIVLKSEEVVGTIFVEVQFKATIGKKRLSMDFDRLERV